jgi:hypothetical protein
MFRKLHSNRDPRDTLLNEINKEFRPYIHKAGKGLTGLVNSHPRFLFTMMVINIVLSAVLSFTVFRQHVPPPKVVKPQANPVSTGFDQIMRTGEKLKRTIGLKRQIDSLTAKKQLSAADSLALEKALDTIQKLNRTAP